MQYKERLLTARFQRLVRTFPVVVDLLLERDGKFFPIEAKVKSQPSRRDARGIKALRDSYPTLDIQPGLVIAPTRRFPVIIFALFAWGVV